MKASRIGGNVRTASRNPGSRAPQLRPCSRGSARDDAAGRPSRSSTTFPHATGRSGVGGLCLCDAGMAGTRRASPEPPYGEKRRRARGRARNFMIVVRRCRSREQEAGHVRSFPEWSWDHLDVAKRSITRWPSQPPRRSARKSGPAPGPCGRPQPRGERRVEDQRAPGETPPSRA